MSTPEESPTNETRQFQLMISFVCIVQVIAAIYEIWKGTEPTITIATFALIATGGLYRRLRWGRRMSTVFLWLMVATGIGLMLPTQIEGDAMMAATSLPMLIAAALGICGAAIISLYFLGKHKSSFRPDWI